MYKAFINGEEGGKLVLRKGGDDVILATLVDVDNIPVNITGLTVTFEIFDFDDKRNAASVSLAGALTVPTAGHATFSPTPGNINFGPGTYYGYVKVDTGTVVTYSRLSTVISVE